MSSSFFVLRVSDHDMRSNSLNAERGVPWRGVPWRAVIGILVIS